MKILIATDGSKFSRLAAEKACQLSKRWTDVSFRVVAVYEAQVPMATEPFALSAEYYQQLDDLARKRAEDASRETVELIRSYSPDASIDIASQIELGIPAQVIVEAAEKWQADLVVVGSHGYGFWGRLALGSVSDAVVHHAPCSVLVVRCQTAEAEK